MLGAIIGDLAGSIYEYDQFKETKPVKINKIIEDNAFISDDTILTVAIADAILNNKDYEDTLKEYALKYANSIPKTTPYFHTMFSPNFIKWAKGNSDGTSSGNGAMMRISPVGFLFNNIDDVIENSRLATIPSHKSNDAITSATIISSIIFYARTGLKKDKIIEKLNLKINKPTISTFNYTCKDTIDVCLYSLFTSSSFEESIRKAISFGGDTDTNACIVGSMAESLFGIPEELKEIALSKLPNEFKIITDSFYKKITIDNHHLL
jgi:ADP-ribosylglycohydrolase